MVAAVITHMDEEERRDMRALLRVIGHNRDLRYLAACMRPEHHPRLIAEALREIYWARNPTVPRPDCLLADDPLVVYLCCAVSAEGGTVDGLRAVLARRLSADDRRFFEYYGGLSDAQRATPWEFVVTALYDLPRESAVRLAAALSDDHPLPVADDCTAAELMERMRAHLRARETVKKSARLPTNIPTSSVGSFMPSPPA